MALVCSVRCSSRRRSRGNSTLPWTMSCKLRSLSVVDDAPGGSEWSRNTCSFLTFGKTPTIRRSAVAPPPQLTRVHPATAVTTDVDVCGTGNGRERKSSTETGPPDPSAVRPVSADSSESTSRAKCPSPDDDDDVFPVADVGSSSIAFSRSTSVSPRRARSCAQPLDFSDVSRSNTASTVKISPPRMKRRKKKNIPEPEVESMKATSSVRQNLALPVATRSSNRGTEVRKQLPQNKTENRSDSNTIHGDSLQPIEQTDSELGSTTRKKNIRWKTDVAQSSPDVASDDADSKESGYITLEDLQAQLGLSSWSSDERQTDQDVFSSSGDEIRPPEILRGAQSSLSTSSAFGTPTTALLIPPPSSSSSFLSPLIQPESFDVFGGRMDCCRSAPPTCDASLLRFTFTVRLDSKMFHRRAASKAGRRDTPLMMVSDGQKGECSTDRDAKPLELLNGSGADIGVLDDQSRDAVENASSKTTESVGRSPSTPRASEQSTEISTVSTAASRLRPDLEPVSSNAQQFAGEKVVVTAEVHRSADQLDAEPPKTSRNTAGIASNYQKLKTKSSTVRSDKPSQRGATRRTVDSKRAISTASRQPDDRITLCSPDAALADRQISMAQSFHRHRSDQVVEGGFNGRMNHVDVDKVVSQAAQLPTFHRQQSSLSTVSQRSSGMPGGLTLTLRKPSKPRHSDHCATDVKTLPRKKTSEASTSRNPRRTDGSGGTSSKVRSSTDTGRRTHRHLSCERTLSRMLSESSSVSSGSEPDICGPCVSRDSTAVMSCSRGCPANCSRHTGKAATAKVTERSLSKTTTGNSTTKRSKSTRRALRQFFRVENLFACRHGRSGSEKYPSWDKELQVIGCEEEPSRVECSEPAESSRRVDRGESVTCRGRCGRSTTTTRSTLQTVPPSSQSRSCRRSRQSRSPCRTDAGGGASRTASRSVSPRSRTLRTAENRRMTATGTVCRASTRQRSRDRSSTVDRSCRLVWNGQTDDEDNPSTQPADWNVNGRGAQRWNTLCVSPSDNSILSPGESGCGFSSRRRVLATTPISPSTPAPDSVATLGM